MASPLRLALAAALLFPRAAAAGEGRDPSVPQKLELHPRLDEPTPPKPELDALFDGAEAPAVPAAAAAREVELRKKARRRERRERRYRAGRGVGGWWTPMFLLAPGGAMLGVQGGRAAAPVPLLGGPPDAQLAAHQERERSLRSRPWVAVVVAGSTAVFLRLLKETDLMESPEKNRLLDFALDFGAAYGLGAAFSSGRLHRDLAVGFSHAIAFSAARAIGARLRGEPTPDPRYEMIAFQAVFALQGRLPWRGNPLFTDGREPAGIVLNALTDTAFQTLWLGAAAGAAEAMRGRGRTPGQRWAQFRQGAWRGAFYGGLTRAAQNAVWGTRVRVDPEVWSESTRIALERGGAFLPGRNGSLDIRAGGIHAWLPTSYGAVTMADWVSFKDFGDLDEPGLVAHERFHNEFQVVGRGLYGFYFPYIFTGKATRRADEFVPEHVY